MFRLLSTASEMQNEGLHGYAGLKKKKAMSFRGLLTNMATTKVGEVASLAKKGAAGKLEEKKVDDLAAKVKGMFYTVVHK